jgi:hypothetical protein
MSDIVRIISDTHDISIVAYASILRWLPSSTMTYFLFLISMATAEIETRSFRIFG